MTTVHTWCLRLRAAGRARPWRVALLAAAVAATALALLASLPAHAEPSPAPSVPTVPGQRTPTAKEQQQIQEVLDQLSRRRSDVEKQAALEAERERVRKLLPDEGGVLGVFDVTDANGLPISVYSVESDTGGMLDWDLGIQNLLTELCFMVTKWLVAFCCWLIAWALGFGLASLLLAPVLSVATSLHARVMVEMGLPGLFLAVCALVCVARIFFGDRVRGWGDAALSLVLAALTATLLSSPPHVLLGEETGAVAAARGLALEVADVILDADPTKPHWAAAGDASPVTSSSLSRPLTDALTDAFIVKPAMLLQYGRVFDGECAAAYADTRLEQLTFDRSLHAFTDKVEDVSDFSEFLGPLGGPVSSVSNLGVDLATDWVVDEYGDPPMDRFEEQCVPGDVRAARKASLDKVGGALFLLIAALIVTVLITALAGNFLVAQCGIAWDAIRAEPALVVGLLPGAGRAFLWDWAACVLRRLGQMLASVIGLAVLILIIQAVLDPARDDWGRELTLRFLIVDIVCIGAIKKRKALAARSHQVAASFRTRMTHRRVGGTHGSAFTPARTAAVPQQRHLARRAAHGAARGTIRTALVGVSLAQGNPLAALAYSMPRTVGATALVTRLQRGSRRRPAPSPDTRTARTGRVPLQNPAPGRRPGPAGAPAGNPPPPTTSRPPQSPATVRPPRRAAAPRPSTTAARRHGTAPTPQPAARRSVPGTAGQTSAQAPAAGDPPATPGPGGAPASRARRHVQAQRAATRRVQRAAAPPPPTATGPDDFSWLADRNTGTRGNTTPGDGA